MLIYDVAFSAETDALKTQLGVLKREVDDMFKLDKFGNKPEAMFDPIKKEGQAAAQFLQQALQKATSVDGVSLSRFNTELAKSGISAEKLASILKQAGMNHNFNALTTTIASADAKLTVFNDHLKEMHRVLTQSVKFRAAMSVQDFLVGQAQAAVKWTKDLNQNMVDIQVVAEKSNVQMQQVFDTTIQKSRELITTAKEYSAASLIYFQQGLDDAEVERRTDITIKAARAAGIAAEEMSKSLTTVWNTYQMTGEQLERSASIAARLGADTAVDFEYIAEAMQTSALGAAQLGLSYENLAAIIATVGETTMMTASVVGNAYKTILTRFDQLKATGTDGEITLGRISQQLADLGVHILDASGELKQMDQIIYETGDAWQSYSQKQQIAVAQVLGGVRQFPQVLALFNNWDKFLRNADTAFSEIGAETLEEQFRVATQSINVMAEQAAEAWQRAFANITNESMLKGFYTIIKDIGNGLDTVIKAFGGIPGILGLIGVAFMKNILEKVWQTGAAIKSNIGDSFAAVGNRLKGEGPTSGAMVAQQRTINSIAATQSGPEQAHTLRQGDTKTLQYYEQLNKAIRDGTEFEKAAAQAEKDRFTSLLASIYESEVKLNDLARASTNAAMGPNVSDTQAGILTATSKIKLEMTPEDVAEIKAELQAALGEEPFEFDFKTDNAVAQVQELNVAMQNFLLNFQQQADRQMFDLVGDVEDEKKKLKELTDEFKQQEKAAQKLESRYSAQKDQLETLGASVDKRSKKYKEFKKSVEELGKEVEAANQKLAAAKKEMDDASASASTAEKRVKGLKDQMSNMQSEGVQQSAQAFKEASNAANDYTRRLEELQAKQAAIGPSLSMPNLAQAISSLSQVAMGVGMLANSFGNLFSAIREGENVGGALLQLLMQLAFLGPMVVKSAMAYTAELKASFGVLAASKAAKAMNVTLMGQELTAETVLAAAKRAGIKLDEEKLMVNGQLNAGLLSKALANKGVAISETAMNGAVAAGTPITAANAAAWWAHPIVLILAAVILAAVAVFALLNAAAKKNAEAARESAQRSQEQAEAINAVQEAVTDASKALEDHEKAMKESTRGTEKHNEAIKATEKTFEDIRSEIEKLGMADLNLDILRNAEAWAIATGDMRDYRQELENVQREIEKKRLADAQFAVKDNLYSAQENWKGGGFLNGSQIFSGHFFGTSDVDKKLIDALVEEWWAGRAQAVSGYGTSLSGSVGIYLDIDWDDPEQFVKDFQSLEELLNTWYDTTSGGEKSDLISGLRDRLDSIRGEYQAVRANLDAIRSLEGNMVYDTGRADNSVRDRSTVTNVEQYEAAINELALAYEKMGYTAEEALSRARGQYRYFASENSELGRQLREIQSLYEQIQAAIDRGQRFGIDRNQMDAAYRSTVAGNEKNLTMFPRVDLRGYRGSSSDDLSSYITREIERLSATDLVIQTRLDLDNALEGIEKLKSEGAEAVRELFDWGPYLNAIGNELPSSYSFFLSMAADQQEEYLRSMANNQVQTIHNALLEEQRRLIESIPPPNVRGSDGEFIINPQLEEYRELINQLMVENEINIKLNFLDDAMLSTTLDELTSKLTTGRIQAEQFEQALDSVFAVEAESHGFDAEEMLAFAAHIQEVAIESDLLSDHLATNKKDAMEAAIAIARLNRGIDSLAGGFEDWNDVLTKSDRASQEYFEALYEMKKAMADVLNIDASDMSSEFIEKNLKAIEEAAEGSVEALAKLQLAAGRDIVLQFTGTLNDVDTVNDILSKLDAIQQYIDTIPIEIRADIDSDNAISTELAALGQAFIDTATQAGMSAEQIAAALQAMGYNARVVTKYEQHEISVPVYTEYSTMSSSNPAQYDDNGTMTTPPTWQRDTWTVHSGNKTMMGQVPVTSVEIDGMNGTFGGNISNYSSVNKGGPPPGGKKSGGGGGGSAPKVQENLKATNNDNRLNYLNDLLGLYGKIEFFGKKEVARLEKEAELQREITDAVQIRSKEAEARRDEAMAGMEKYGAVFKVDAQGLAYLSNLEEIVAKYGDTNEDLAEALKTYTDAESKLVDARGELMDAQVAMLDKMLAAALSINKQTVDYQDRAIKIAETWQSSYIRGARILTDATGNLFGEMSLKDNYYAGAARLLNMYFDKDMRMMNNFFKKIEQETLAWEKVKANNDFAAMQNWDYSDPANLENRAAILEEMHGIQDRLIQTLQDAYEHNQKAWATFNQILDEWEDHMDVIYGKFEGMKSVLGSMLDIAKMSGTAMFTPQQRQTLLTLQRTQLTVNKEQLAAAKTRMDLEQKIVDEQRTAVDNFIAARDRTYGSISDDEFARQLQSMNEMTRKMEDNLQKAQDEYWSTFKGSVEDAWNYYEAYGEEVIYRMKYNLAQGKGFEGSAAQGSWSFLGQMLDFRNEELDRTLNPGQQLRQVTELIRQLEQFDMDQITTMDIYNDLMNDLLKAKEGEVELTEYDYQILVERFNLIKAQAAFEDAREAKNTMRLARDASGNWSYIYSADPDKQKDTQKDVEDSLNKIYELSYDRIRSLVNELYGLPDELATALSKLDPNDPKYEEQALKIREYFTNRANYLIQQIDNAEMNSANILNLVVQSKITDLDYLQSVQRLGKITVEDLYGTELGWLLTSEEGNKHLRDVIHQTVGDQIDNWKELQLNIRDVFVAAGEDVDTFQAKWSTRAQQIGADAQKVGKQFQETAVAMSNAISTMIKQQEDWAIQTARQMASIVASIQAVIAEIHKMEGLALGYDGDLSTGNIWRTGDIAAEMGRMIEAQNIAKHKGENSAAALADIINSNAFQQLIRERNAKIAAQGIEEDVPSTDALLNLISRGAIGWDNTHNSWVYWSDKDHKRIPIEFEDLMRMATSSWRPPNFTAFKTGGLVPGYGDGDRVPAMLTPAEYVLNPEDTKAFFKAFHQFMSMPNFTGEVLDSLGKDALQQAVSIYADFPNVSSRDEIQAALNNLINQAKQYNV